MLVNVVRAPTDDSQTPTPQESWARFWHDGFSWTSVAPEEESIRAVVATPSEAWGYRAFYVGPNPDVRPTRHSITEQFARGVDGVIPKHSVADMVDRVVRLIEAKMKDYIYSVDDDGAFSFDGWLPNGLFIMCEIADDGEINAGLYHGRNGPDKAFLANITESELRDLF